jgi:hypothetical protein
MPVVMCGFLIAVLAVSAAGPAAGTPIAIAAVFLVLAILWRRFIGDADRRRLSDLEHSLRLQRFAIGNRATAIASHRPHRKCHSLEGLLWAEGTHRGQAVTVAEFRYVIGHGRAQEVYHFTAVTCGAPVRWPLVTLRPRLELYRRRLGELFKTRPSGLEDRELERRWNLECADPRFVVAALSPPIQAWLVAGNRAEEWSVGQGSVQLVHRGALDAQGVERLLSRLLDFRAMLPKELDEW